MYTIRTRPISYMYDFVLFIIIIYNILQVDSTAIYSYTNLRSIIGFLFIIHHVSQIHDPNFIVVFVVSLLNTLILTLELPTTTVSSLARVYSKKVTKTCHFVLFNRRDAMTHTYFLKFAYVIPPNIGTRSIADTFSHQRSALVQAWARIWLY